jgi:hypothetical protein
MMVFDVQGVPYAILGDALRIPKLEVVNPTDADGSWSQEPTLEGAEAVFRGPQSASRGGSIRRARRLQPRLLPAKSAGPEWKAAVEVLRTRRNQLFPYVRTTPRGCASTRRGENPSSRSRGGWTDEHADRRTPDHLARLAADSRHRVQCPLWTLGGAAMSAQKLADTDAQIRRLRRHVSEHCVSIASSIDTTPAEMVPPEMRERWLHELRQAAVALALVVDRLASGPKAEA